MGDLLQFLSNQKAWLAKRLSIPTKDVAAVAAYSALYGNAPLTEEQIVQADRAIIDYVLGRIATQAKPKF